LVIITLSTYDPLYRIFLLIKIDEDLDCCMSRHKEDLREVQIGRLCLDLAILLHDLARDLFKQVLSHAHGALHPEVEDNV
jgi:hypothetical protein